MRLRSYARRHQIPALLLLLAALLMRAAVPQGYMISSEEPGKIAVTICGSDLLWQHMAKPHDRAHGLDHGAGHDGEHGADHRDSAPCTFAGFTAPAAPPDVQPALRLPATAVMAFAANTEVLRLVAIPRALPPARAPPLPV